MAPRFDRFDICQAHYLFARHFHVGGDTQQRDFERLNRMKFSPGLSLREHEDPDEALTENGAAIYRQLVQQEKHRYARWRAALARDRRSISNPDGKSRFQGGDLRAALRADTKMDEEW